MIYPPPKPGVEANDDLIDDNALARVAIAGATAIQRIIAERASLRNRVQVQQQELDALSDIVAERDSLRNRVQVQQQDLEALNDINNDLRGRAALVHHQYIQIAKMIVSHLEKLDQATRDGIRDQEDIPRTDLAALVSLANRLKPNNSASRTDESESSER